MLLSAIQKLINSVWNKEGLPDQWEESIIIIPVHKKGDKTDYSKYRGMYHCYQFRTKLYRISFSQSEART
jgi:hypothetical protein